MFKVIIYFAVLSYFLHLMCENFSVLIKYTYASDKKFMRGFVLSNYFAIFSRLFISIFGVLISIAIEKNEEIFEIYLWMMLLALLFASFLSYFLSKFTIQFEGDKFSKLKKIDNEITPNGFPIVRIYESIFYGLQFVAVGLAYGVSIMIPDYRLTVVSFVPVASMLGTFVSLVIIEPKFASLIDINPSVATLVCSKLLFARTISFGFTFFAMCVMYLVVKI